jgi:hypothetical protein
LGSSPNNDVVIGDLNERYQRGCSYWWYLRQVLLAITIQRWRQVRTTSGGYMRRTITVGSAVIMGLFLFLFQAQAQFTIHAASEQPVTGWDRMEYNTHAVWVNPAASITSADVLRAEPNTRPDGARAVGVVFNDEGAKKMTDLSHAQLNKLIAVVVDGRVIFAPKVRAEMGREALVTGPAPSGLSTQVVRRIVDSANKK